MTASSAPSHAHGPEAHAGFQVASVGPPIRLSTPLALRVHDSMLRVRGIMGPQP